MTLIRLWVAEGFVEVKAGMTKEEVAEGYVNELINRSLVQVAKKRRDGRSKSYRIHDLWREIVVSKSREQNFVSLTSAEKLTRVTELPEEILKLQYLRHLLLTSVNKRLRGCYDGFHVLTGFKVPKGIGSLTSLQKLCYIEAENGNGKVLCSSLEKLNNLQSLHVGAKEEDEIIDLDSLSSAPRRIRTLYLKGRLQDLPHWIHSLHNLTRVCLWWSKLRDVDPLQSFQDLPHLVSLNLGAAYEGEGLCFKAGGFESLKCLCLTRMEGLKWVRVEAGSMPLLEEAYLCECKSMKKLPSGIEHLTNLKLLDLADLSDSLITSLNRDLKGGDFWKIAHIPKVLIVDSKSGIWKITYL
ncbi:disease resistance protein RPH8A-like [Rhododendron vialii]|uniref:disease resistance protein RPH8A-like n=1 Tax=Rhododendron vialii TaxID=182163 RepID=UPI00265EF4A9|nr:disease resistance protein RPH8A-like [Rhododendron vialii]